MKHSPLHMFLHKFLAPRVEGEARMEWYRALSEGYYSKTGYFYRWGFMIEPLCVVRLPRVVEPLLRQLDWSNPSGNQLRDLCRAYVDEIRHRLDNDMVGYCVPECAPNAMLLIMAGTQAELKPHFPGTKPVFIELGAAYTRNTMKANDPTLYNMGGALISGVPMNFTANQRTKPRFLLPTASASWSCL